MVADCKQTKKKQNYVFDVQLLPGNITDKF